MFCAISGVSPLQPVISLKSGYVYERNLIEKYLKENDGKDPTTGDSLELSDLIDVKTVPSAPAPPPRAPSLSSVPALLHVLQNEWDASMLECYELRKQNASLRQELSHALYKEDASMRVLARVMRERDEAREALGSVQSSLGAVNLAGGNKDSGAPDTEMNDGDRPVAGLSEEALQRIDNTSKALSATRKKRKVPAGYVTPATLKSYVQQTSIPSLHSTKPPGLTCLKVTGANDNLIVSGGMDKTVQIYDRETEKVVATLKGATKKIACLVVVGGEQASAESLPKLIAAASDKSIRFWSPSETKASYSPVKTLSNHTAEVTGLDLHPSGTLLLSGSLDGTWAIHDLECASGKPSTLITVSLDDVPADVGISTVQWHPDGGILATGLTNSSIKIFDVKTSSCVANFAGHSDSGGGPIRSLSFSENGYSLASLSTTSTSIKLWDLRKLTNYHTVQLPESYQAKLVQWDPSAQFLAVVGNDLRIWQNKTWEQLIVFDGNTAELTGLSFVKQGKEILVGGMDRTVTILSAPVSSTKEETK